MAANSIAIDKLMRDSGVQFGTSGARGLVTAMTDQVCYSYTRAFLQHLAGSKQFRSGGSVAIAGDFRRSTPRILLAAAKAIADHGGRAINCGNIPTPALAAYAFHGKMPSIMVTGSHIPEDRNGIKFNSPDGEITKADEAGMRQQRVALPADLFAADGMFAKPEALWLPPYDAQATQQYIQRYVQFFPETALNGLTVLVYEHSSVCRTVFGSILSALGASVVPVHPSDEFVSVDTEAIRPEDVVLGKTLAEQNRFDAIVSADGDGDRPLMSDETGTWLRGDVAGILCAKFLGADAVATPVSSNTAVEKCGFFKRVIRTRIGSPYVIEGMHKAADDAFRAIVGYEANGGFLTYSNIRRDGRSLPALPTRDSILVPLAILAMAKQEGKSVSQLIGDLPQRFTASDRVKDFPTDHSQRILSWFVDDPRRVNETFHTLCGPAASMDRTDGIRITFVNEEIIHLRPSGNAPEFRCYVEASTPERAQFLNTGCIAMIENWRTEGFPPP